LCIHAHELKIALLPPPTGSIAPAERRGAAAQKPGGCRTVKPAVERDVLTQVSLLSFEIASIHADTAR